MKKEDVEKLSKLSRLSLRDEEKDEFVRDFNSILGYVSEINSALGENAEREIGLLKNVMREDGEPHEPEKYTAGLIRNVPDTEDNFVKVRQVFE